MFFFLSKFLPLFVYPLGLACLLLALAILVRRRRWQTVLILTSLTMLWLGGNRLISMAVVRSLEARHPPLVETPHGPVIVVLGGGTRTQTAPRLIPELNEAGDRLLYATWLYKQGAASHLLLSGSNAPLLSDGTVSEAETMAQALAIMGVPREAIWLEPGSLNTHENAGETRKLLSERGIDEIILVTSALHMPRSVRLFERQGFSVIPAPTDFLVTQADWAHYTRLDWRIQALNLLPNADNLAYTTWTLREYIGMLIYGLRGWL